MMRMEDCNHRSKPNLEGVVYCKLSDCGMVCNRVVCPRLNKFDVELSV